MSNEPNIWAARLNGMASALAVVGGFGLIAIVVIVFVGVLMRYVFAAPILGVNEIVQLTAVAVVMSALPYCTARNDHVAVDVFDNFLGRYGRFFGDILSRAVSGFVLSVLCRRAALKALDALEWGDATNMLRVPIWPFYAILSLGAGLCVLIFALQLVVIVMRGPK